MGDSRPRVLLPIGLAYGPTTGCPLTLQRAYAPLLLALLALLALAPPASAITQKQAARKALAALGTEKRSDAVIVFGLPKPVKAGTEVTQAGTAEPSAGSSKGLPARLRAAGVRAVRTPTVVRGPRDERVFFFYEDRGPFMLYQHPGRVALVGAESGRVRLSKTITWPPVVNGRLPAFLKSAGAYRSAKYQVLYRPWSTPNPVQQRPAARVNRNLFDQDPFGPGRPLPSLGNAKAIAARLAAERSCVLRVTDTLPAFWNVNELNLTRSYVGTLFEQLERDDPGFIDERYGARSGESLAEAVDDLIGRGCKDILLYIAGQGYDSADEPVIHLGTALMEGGLLAQHNLSASDLRELIEPRSGVTFKLKIDAPYAGDLVERLRDLANVVLIETAGPPKTQAFSFIPEIEAGGEMARNQENPAGMLEFTNCELVGLKVFFESAEEIDKATQAQNEGVSFLAEMLARSQELCVESEVGFADDLGVTPQLAASERGSGNGTNRPPVAQAQTVEVTEDEPKEITLGASDPDGDPLTFTTGGGPSHGTLTGSGASRTYTPNASYNGPDSFTFTVSDGKGGSATETVTIAVKAENDPPVVTSSSGSTAYTEQGAQVPVDPSLTVSDADDSQLDGATVKIASAQPGDELRFTPQLGISGTYDSGTGVLTLTGSASPSDYQQALRDVAYRNLTNDDPAATRSIEFRADDGDSPSAAATKAVAVTRVNDRPLVDTTNAALAYAENAGAKAVDDGITVADPDSQIVGATVEITSNFSSAEDDLAFAPRLGITGSYNDSTGTLTLTGPTSAANYQAALRTVTYANVSENPSSATRTVSFQVDDGAAADNLSTIESRNVDVTPVDDVPDAVNDAATVDEDANATEVAVLTNDTDPDGGQKTISSGTDPPHGTLVLTGGSPGARTGLTYQPDPDYCGSDSFSYTVNGGDSATVSVTVTCQPDNPVANDDTQTVTEDASATSIPVLSNDTDADTGDAIDVTNVSDPPKGTATIVDGTPDRIAYTPDANACGADSFTYTVNGGDTATVAVTVTCDNDAPVANDDSPAAIDEDAGATNLSVLSNDTDVEGDAIEITGVTDPPKGTATIVDGTPDRIAYTPDANACGSDSFSYTVNGGDTATVSMSVTCVDDPPVANDDSPAAIAEDAAAVELSVLSNDTDVENDAIQITNVGSASKGTAALVDGTGSNPDKISYAPTANACGAESFTYTVNGGDTATVSFTVTCADDAPVANDDSPAAIDEDAGATNLSVLSNDTDVEGDAIEITGVTDPPKGTATIVDGTPDRIAYTPDANACGADSFSYTVNGGDTATVSMTVTCVADNPVASDDTAAVAEDAGATSVNVLANDVDPDAGDTITITSATDPPKGTVGLTGPSGAHTGLTYKPDANYCNSAASPAAPDTFEYTVNGGDTATVSVTVNCVNDPPVANDDTKAVGEDSGATNIDVLGNDTDVETDAIDVTAVTQGGKGAVAIVATTPEQVSYSPNADYCNNPPGTVLDSFTYTVNGGDTATVTVTVDCVDDAPVAVADSATVGEDSSANTIDVRANDTDVDGGTKTIASKTNGTNGVVAITNSDTEVTYTPNADYCGSDSFTYALNGNSSTTVSVTVTCVNDVPAIDLNGPSNAGSNNTVTFTQPSNLTGGNPVTLAPNADTSDVDDSNLESATIALTNEQNAGVESLAVDTTGTAIVANVAANGDTITLTGSASHADYEKVLKTVTYNNTASLPSATDRVVEFKVNDGDANSTISTATVKVVPFNVPPTLDLDSTNAASFDAAATFTEGTAATAAPNADAGDADDANLASATVTLTSRPDGNAVESLSADTTGTGISASYVAATGVLTLSGSQPVADYDTVLRKVKYDNTSDAPSGANRSVTFKVNDGEADSDTRTSTVSIQAVNDGPVNTVPAGQTFDEDTTRTFSGANSNAISVSDADAASVEVTLTVQKGTLTLSGTSGVSFSTGDGTTDATMTFSGAPATVNDRLNGLVYSPNANYAGGDTLSVATSDGGSAGSGGALGDSDSVALTISAVNDAPQNTVPPAQSVNEDTPLVFNAANANLVSTSDLDADQGDVRVTLSAPNGALTLATTSGLTSFSPAGADGLADKTMTFEGTLTEVNAALNGLTYQGDLNYNGSDTITLTVNDRGNTGSGATGEDTDTIAVTLQPVNDAPTTATDDFNGTESAVGNTILAASKTPPGGASKQITGNVLNDDTNSTGPSDDDTDVDGDTVTVVDETVQSTGGGTVDIDSNGTFTYLSDPSDNCPASDTFTYKATDGTLQSNGTVNVAISGCVWYVDNDPAETGNAGTSTDPFDALSSAEAKGVSGQTVYVHKGTASYGGGFSLDGDERLIGETSSLVVGSDTLFAGGGDAKRPTITDAAADAIELGAASTVRGIQIDPAGGGGVLGSGSGDAGGTIDNVRVVDAAPAGTGEGLELNATSGTFAISDFTYSNSGASSTPAAVKLTSAGTVNFASSGTISITKQGGPALSATSTSMGSGSTFDDITVTGSSTGGVSMTGTTGTTHLGDGSGTDLSLTTTGGTALALSEPGTVHVAGAADDNVSATNGPAIEVSYTGGNVPNATPSTFEFDDVDSTNSSTTGISLTGIGTSAFEANSSSDVKGAGTVSFSMSGTSSGDVSYRGGIGDPAGTNDGDANAAQIAGRTGGTVTLSGSIDDDNDAGGGIRVTGNSGGSTVFSGTAKTINTLLSSSDLLKSHGVVFSSSPNHTLTFSNGGLDIDTPSGAAPGNGLNASGGGTIAVSGSGNTIDSGTATALTVDGTTIGDADLSFDRISSSGATNGIRLNSTSNAGGSLTVSGSGGTCASAGTCTGGAIQSSSGAGIELTNVPGGVSLTRMAVTGGQDDGIRASSVGTSGSAGLGLTNAFVSANGNAVGERGLDYDNVKGSSSIASTTVTGSAEENARIDTDNGTLLLTVSGSTFSSNSTSTGGDGVTLYGDGNAVIRANVSSNTFSANRDDAFQLVTSGAATGSIDLTFNSNSVNAGGNSGSPSAQSALNFDSAGSTTVKVAMNGGTVQGSDGSAIILNPIDTSSFDATISGVQVGTATALSGSETGIGMWVKPAENANADVAITNNTIRNVHQDGLHMRHNDGGGTSDFTVTGNTISNVGAGGYPIWVQSGSISTDSTTVCADIGGTSPALENNFAGQASGGPTDIGFRKQSAPTNHLKLPGFDGNMANLTSYIQNRNAGSPTVSSSGTLEAGPASCDPAATPTLP